jgi:hypothetical protein
MGDDFVDLRGGISGLEECDGGLTSLEIKDSERRGRVGSYTLRDVCLDDVD